MMSSQGDAKRSMRGATMAARIKVECLRCGHYGMVLESDLPRYGIKPEAPIAAFIKRLTCRAYGSHTRILALLQSRISPGCASIQRSRRSNHLTGAFSVLIAVGALAWACARSLRSPRSHPAAIATAPPPCGVPTRPYARTTRRRLYDLALLYLGIHLFDNCDLEALADAAAARRRWEFLLTAAPLAIRGGTGSPANPIATF